MGKPTHPSKITQKAIEAALAKIADEKEEGGFPLLDADRTLKGISEGVLCVLEGSNKARAARSRIIQQRLPVKRAKPKQDIEAEKLSKNVAIERKRVKSPFTLPVELLHRLSSELAARTHRTIPEPSLRPTGLDLALEPHERDALGRYIDDRSAELERDPTPHRRRTALARLAFIHKALSNDDKQDLQKIARMIIPVDDFDPQSTEEFGSEFGKCGDSRKCEGVFIGVGRKLAQRLHTLGMAYRASQELLERASTCRTSDYEMAA
jgi:hypothetical protein